MEDLFESAIRQTASEMLADLDCNYLEVVLIPSLDPDRAIKGGMIRAVQYQNARWYRDFCKCFPSNRKANRRKFQTKIKRQATRRALVCLSSGEVWQSCYVDRLHAFMVNHYSQSIAA